METVGIVLFFIIASIAMTVAIVFGMSKYTAKRKELAKSIGMELGLAYSDGWEALKRFYAEHPGPVSLDAYEKMPSFLKKMMESMAPWRLDGEKNGVRVSVYEERRSSGKSSVTYIVGKAYYPTPLNWKLKAAKEGIFTKIGKGLFGLKDVEIGVPEFDDAVRVNADDDAAARTLFGNPSVYGSFLKLVQRFPETFADSTAAVRERANAKPELAELRELVELLSAFAANVR